MQFNDWQDFLTFLQANNTEHTVLDLRSESGSNYSFLQAPITDNNSLTEPQVAKYIAAMHALESNTTVTDVHFPDLWLTDANSFYPLMDAVRQLMRTNSTIQSLHFKADFWHKNVSRTLTVATLDEHIYMASENNDNCWNPDQYSMYPLNETAFHGASNRNPAQRRGLPVSMIVLRDQYQALNDARRGSPSPEPSPPRLMYRASERSQPIDREKRNKAKFCKRPQKPYVQATKRRWGQP